jgi:hypothetical protein
MSKEKSGMLGIRDIVFMNVIAILSLRQIPNVAPYGASAIILWLIAAFCLFFPLQWLLESCQLVGLRMAAFLFGAVKHLGRV